MDSPKVYLQGQNENLGHLLTSFEISKYFSEDHHADSRAEQGRTGTFTKQFIAELALQQFRRSVQTLSTPLM